MIEKSLRLTEACFGQKVPDSVTCAPAFNRGMIFTDDTGKAYKFESRGLNIWRDKFDFWLLSLAKESGVTVKDETAVTAVEERDGCVRISTNGGEEYSKFAVDCSGAIGAGRRAHGHIITHQNYYKGSIDLDPQYFYAYLQPELSDYDAWFNVKDGMLVLGTAAANPKEIQGYYKNFLFYMTERHGLRIDELIRTDEWLIRNITPPFSIDYGNGGILKAGEAAGLLNPMGEGISSALESGYFAAQAILLDFENRQSVTEKYRQLTAETVDYMQRQWRLVGRMSEKFSFMYR